MAIAAMIAWVLTASIGAYMLRTWVMAAVCGGSAPPGSGSRRRWYSATPAPPSPG